MSSGEENLSDAQRAGKKKRTRRVQRACDACKRKKIRCDWLAARGNKCTYCQTHQLDCSHTHGIREEKPGSPEEYVEDLERTVKLMAAWMYQHHPDIDLGKLFGVPHDIDKWMRERQAGAGGAPPASPDINDAKEGHAWSGNGNEDFKLSNLTNRMEKTHLTSRFLGRGSVLGKSSAALMIHSAMRLKHEYDAKVYFDAKDMRAKRQSFWKEQQPQIEQATSEPGLFDFPPADLMYSLISIWFELRAPLAPLLHRPTFMKNLSDGLHYRDGAFACVVLLVLANGSKFSDDKRVLDTDSPFSAGWKWYRQAKECYCPAMACPTLHDLQSRILACYFLERSSLPHKCWTMCAVALRLAIDVGVHQRAVYQTEPNVEDEQWKRAFWALVVLDRWLSAQLGRPCVIQEEDFDLALPVECDDEYWEYPDTSIRFKQPADKPSLLSFWISYIRLTNILGVAMRSIFSLNPRSNILLGLIGKGWEQRIISALDSALNEWVDSIPNHLKWGSNHTDPIIALQSGFLYSYYYQLQIMIHRCFIPTPQKPASTTFPSLAICTNAARSCCQILSSCRKRLPQYRGIYFVLPAFHSALALVYNIWGSRRHGMAIDYTKDMERIQQCMEVMKDGESRFSVTGKLWDIIYELVYMSDLPLPSLPESNEPSPPGPPSTEETSSCEPSPVGLYSLASSGSGHYASTSSLQTHSQDLGRLPVHTSFSSLPELALPGPSSAPQAPASYSSLHSFGAPNSGVDTSVEMDAVLASLGMGPQASTSQYGTVPTGNAAGAGASSWDDISLGANGLFNWPGHFTPHDYGQNAQVGADAFGAPQQGDPAQQADFPGPASGSGVPPNFF